MPHDGAELTGRWVDELHDLGFCEPSATVPIDNPTVGSLDREHALEEVLTRLAARRSAWNAADIRGEVEQLLARRNVVVQASVRCELAEDLTARTVAECVSMLGRDSAPEHIRALASRHVLDVEADLVGRIAARADAPVSTPPTVDASTAVRLDHAQQEAVRALAGNRRLLVLEGAAGAGKTTVLAATRTAVEGHAHRLVVVTPTLKAADVAAHEVGTRAYSAAWLAYQHGYRWRDDGSRMRLAHGDVDPETGIVFTGPRDPAQLQRDDLLLVDEAAMLDQDTARALMTIADERNARVALVGDRHQLPAVGRGGCSISPSGSLLPKRA